MLLRRIGPFSCAKISGIIYAIVGLILGGLFSFIALVGTAFSDSPSSALFGVGAVIILPIIYGGLGFVGGALMAWLYNVVASWIGGIEMEFEEERPAPQNLSGTV
jgi:hypothetical protein